MNRQSLTSALLVMLVVGSVAWAQDLGGAGSGGRGGGLPTFLRMFEAERDGLWLNRLEVSPANWSGGYSSTDAATPARVYVLDGDLRVLRVVTLPLPLRATRVGDGVELPIPSMQVPKRYGIGFRSDSRLQIGPAADGNSYDWEFGQPLRSITRAYAIRPTLGEKPVTAPDAVDLVILNSGEVFFDRFVKTEGDPPCMVFAQRGPVAQAALFSLRPGAACTPTEETWVVINGQRRGKLVSADDKTVVYLPGAGQQPQQVARATVTELRFEKVLVFPEGTGPSPGGSSRGGSGGGSY